MGWRAVSSVDVMIASGCVCNNVIGYSGVGALNKATRNAVCFHAPVSLYTRTLLADRHSRMPK